MLKKNFNIFKDWVISTLLTFLLCETFWFFWIGELQIGSLWLLSCAVDLLYCAIFSLISICISRAFYKTKFARKLTLSNQVFFLVVILFVNMGVAYLCGHIYDWLFPDEEPDNSLKGIYVFCLFATVLTLLHSTYHYCVMAIRQKDELVAMQKRALKRQLDPHFVFNSLSSLAELTHESPEKAEHYVVKLSKVYRYILSHIEQDYSSVEDSIHFIQDYVALQEIRLMGKVELQVDAFPVEQNEMLLPMSLQLLVENAIKHNPPTSEKPLIIQISRENDKLVVRNTVFTVNEPVTSFGIGLESLRERCQIEGLTPPEMHILDGWFEVRVPIIKK